ncbi:DUF4350 domain-containing protein [Amycolatopsis sp. NPDC059657]|uniref:DUF4350 domain-containing protein n=1 Tax=Amycolatopsis sp. NPDC059657 TaxID=3346899 RepID=UPI0036710B61
MSTSVSPDARRIWLNVRWPLAFIVFVLVAGAVLTLAGGQPNREFLDPASYQPKGSHALAKLLEDRGVDIETVHTANDADASLDGESTLFVVLPEMIDPERLGRLAERAGDVVLLSPQQDVTRVVPSIEAGGLGEVAVYEPGCQLEAAVSAGSARVGGIRYRATGSDVTLCYQGSLAQIRAERGTTTLVGSAAPVTNERLAEEGNAALMTRLLGTHSKLVWYIPSPSDIDAAAKKTFYDLVPDGWKFAVIELGFAAVLVALWRARRLGPVVTEPLPIVVRAAETTEGRARLYRRSGAADHASETLREASRARLKPLLGLPVDAEPAAVVASAAQRLGRPEAEIGAVLYGTPVTDDQTMVRLADALDELERKVGE